MPKIYPGGKNSQGTFHKIINQMPRHDLYVEPFLGSGAILRKKAPAKLSMGFDLSEEAINLTRAKISQDQELSKARIKLARSCGLEFCRSNVWRGTDDELVYFDPPYLIEARSSKRPIYDHEFSTVKEHQGLLETVFEMSTQGVKVMLSGYRSQLYDRALAHWRRVDFLVGTQGGRSATESLWMNYPEPEILHDYQFWGANWRDRDWMNKMLKREHARLMKMPAQKRNAYITKLLKMIDW